MISAIICLLYFAISNQIIKRNNQIIKTNSQIFKMTNVYICPRSSDFGSNSGFDLSLWTWTSLTDKLIRREFKLICLK